MEKTENKKVFYDSAIRPPAYLEELFESWRYRDLILLLVQRDVTSRYKRSVLGMAWTMLNPLGMMIVLSVVFSRVFRNPIEGYPAYVLSGLIAWNFFSQVSIAIINSLMRGEDLFNRIYVPRAVFAFSSIGTGLVNLALSLVPLLLVMMVLGIPPRLTLILVPFAMIFLALFTLGIGLIISTIGIYFMDVVEMYSLLLLAWIYLTPVIYSMNMLPLHLQQWLSLNPMVYLIEIFRDLVFYGVIPPLRTWLLGFGISSGTFLAGWLFFTRKIDEFPYRT